MRRTGAGLCPCDGAVVFCGWPGGGRAAVLLSGGCCRCQRHFLLPGFYLVLCGGRTITANKEAGFVEFWRGSRLPCSPRAALAVILLLWLFFGCIDGHTEIVTLPVIGFVRLRGCVLFLFFRRLPQDIAINPVTTPCQEDKRDRDNGKKGGCFAPFALFQLVNGGLYRVFLFVVLRVEKLCLPFTRASRSSVAISSSACAGDACASSGTGTLFSSFICMFPFIKI